MQPTTLFLDRDGVINRRLPGAYVRHFDEEFEFLPGVLETMPLLAQSYDLIIVITNQQGIGKGLMTEETVRLLHAQMTASITAHGGRIDAVFFCPHLSSQNCRCRKPEPGMALQARYFFPDLQFQHAVMVGDSASDILFGERLGMTTVLLEGKGESTERFVNKQGKLVKPDVVFSSFNSLGSWKPPFFPSSTFR